MCYTFDELACGELYFSFAERCNLVWMLLLSSLAGTIGEFA